MAVNVEITRQEVGELFRRVTELEKGTAVQGEQLDNLEQSTGEIKSDLKALSERLFGSVNGPGEIFKIQGVIIKASAMLVTAAALIAFFFGNGSFSLKVLTGK